MKKLKYVLLFILIGIGCRKKPSKLLRVKYDKEISLTDLDTVKKYLNGFWLLEDTNSNSEGEKILSLKFGEKNVSSWMEDEVFDNGDLIVTESSASFATLIKVKDTVCLEFLGLTGVGDTVNIKYLSKTKLSIGNLNYRKHKGYAILEY